MFFIYKKDKNRDRNNTTLLTSKCNYVTYINKYLWDTGLHSFHSGDFFVHTCTHLLMHTPINLHVRTHYSDAHTSCEKVSLRLLPKSHQKSSQSTRAVYSSFTMFVFVSFIILCHTKLCAPISPFKSSLPALLEISCHLSTECKKLP